MKIEFDFEHYCYDCGEELGVFVPIQKDAIRSVYIIKMQPCNCSTNKKNIADINMELK